MEKPHVNIEWKIMWFYENLHSRNLNALAFFSETEQALSLISFAAPKNPFIARLLPFTYKFNYCICVESNTYACL